MRSRFVAFVALGVASACASTASVQHASAADVTRLLPPASRMLWIPGDAMRGPALLDVVEQLEAATGVEFAMSSSTRAELERTDALPRGGFEIEPEDAWLVVQGLLEQRGYLVVLSQDAPRLVSSAEAFHVDAVPVARPMDAEWFFHPALLISVAVDTRPLSADQVTSLLWSLRASASSVRVADDGGLLALTGSAVDVRTTAGWIEMVAEAQRAGSR